MKFFSRIILILLLTLTVSYARWGWGSHRFINDAAVDHLPEAMSFFQDHRDYLSDHSTDPDTDDDPGYYHYIDIDYYPEFQAGTLPHTWVAMIDLYGQNTMEDNGLVPWVIEWWMNDLTSLMQDGDWNNAWQFAAELGHYVADSHQALHLTLNYNGQLSNNYGIHSRYETQMMNPRLADISFPDSIAGYWDSPIDSVFSYITDIYPIVDLVMAADDRADAVDSNHGNTYYNMLWEDLGDTTIWSLNRAAVDLASVWYTAWVNAGSPYPPGVVAIDEIQTPRAFQVNAYPNPFNARTLFQFSTKHSSNLSLTIYDLSGRLVKTIFSDNIAAGTYTFNWDGTSNTGAALTSGVYLAEFRSPQNRTIQKISLIK